MAKEKTYEEYANKQWIDGKAIMAKADWIAQNSGAPADDARKVDVVPVVPVNAPTPKRQEAPKQKEYAQIQQKGAELEMIKNAVAPEQKEADGTLPESDVEKISGILNTIIDTQNKIVDDMLKDRERVETIGGTQKLFDATLQNNAEDLDNFQKRLDALESFAAGIRFERGAEKADLSDL